MRATKAELAELADAVRCEPESVTAVFAYAHALQRAEKNNPAAVYYRKLLPKTEHDERRPWVFNNLGVALHGKSSTQALAACESALKLLPENHRFMINVAVLQVCCKGKLDTAVVALDRAARGCKAHSAMKTASLMRRWRGVVLERLNRLDEAVRDYASAIALDAENLAAQEDLETTLALQRRDQKARLPTHDLFKEDPDDPSVIRDAELARGDARRKDGHRDTSGLEDLLRHFAAPEPRKVEEDEASLASLAAAIARVTKPAWCPGLSVGEHGPGVLYMPDVRKAPPSDPPKGLATQWRRARAKTAPEYLVFDGEYLAPRPAFLDPIGCVSRAPPFFARPRHRPCKPPSQQLLRNREAIRIAVKNRSLNAKAALAFKETQAPKLCWDSPPKDPQLRCRIPASTLSYPDDRETTLLERHLWK